METEDHPQEPAGDLKALVRAKFGKLSDAEKLLLEKVPYGDLAICSPNDNDADPKNNPKYYWEPTRQIRAELIGWLCTDEHGRKNVHPRGIQVYGADVIGPLNLSFVSIPFQMVLRHCRLEKGINLQRAEVSQIDLQGSLVHGIEADGLIVRNAIFLRSGFEAVGRVRLHGAQIGGNLDCDAGTFTNPPGKNAPARGDEALHAERINVRDSVFLRNGFTAKGGVSLIGAQIGSVLDCSNATFNNPSKRDVPGSGMALSADGINAKSSVLLRGTKANGTVSLLGAQIGGDLDCSGGIFKGSPVDGVQGSGPALQGQRMNVKDAVFLAEGFSANGEVILEAVAVGGPLFCQGGNFQMATLDLVDASAGTLVDSGLDDPADPRPTLWPRQGNLLLNGFAYSSFAPGRINVGKRLEWLGLQPRTPFPSRSYIQLAKVIRESGNDDGAKRVLMKMEELRRSDVEHGPIAEVESWVLKWSIGYGYHPMWAFWEIAGLSALGWIIYRRSYLAGGIAPTDNDAYKNFKAGRHVPEQCPPFSPIVYSVENSLPLVKLGQTDKWHPDPESQAPLPLNAPAPKLGHRGTWAWPPDKLQSVLRAFRRGLAAIWGRAPKALRNTLDVDTSQAGSLAGQLGIAARDRPAAVDLVAESLRDFAQVRPMVCLDTDFTRLAARHPLRRRRDRSRTQRVKRWAGFPSLSPGCGEGCEQTWLCIHFRFI